MQRLTQAFFYVILILTQGCSTMPEHQDSLVTQLDGPLAQLQVDTKQLFQRMQRLTSDKSCQTDQQCQVFSLGQRSCGGPEQFIAYSVQQTDVKLLAFTNERYMKLKQQQQQRLGLLNQCQVLPEPEVKCIQQQCILMAN